LKTEVHGGIPVHLDREMDDFGAYFFLPKIGVSLNHPF
jgi:hypothetical protein